MGSDAVYQCVLVVFYIIFSDQKEQTYFEHFHALSHSVLDFFFGPADIINVVSAKLHTPVTTRTTKEDISNVFAILNLSKKTFALSSKFMCSRVFVAKDPMITLLICTGIIDTKDDI
mmetsp:Transcript_4114/g.8576  ORF Transcript_4114/g.8576 Transcript_4114/m.8576 type:complete len:117 (-) Transcript_4114:300-650(-)